MERARSVKEIDRSLHDGSIGELGPVIQSSINPGTARSAHVAATSFRAASPAAPQHEPESRAEYLAGTLLVQVFDLLPQAILIVRHDHRIVYRNAAAKSLIAATAGSPDGLPFSPDVAGNSRLWAAVLAALAAGPADEAQLVNVPRAPPGRALIGVVRRLEANASARHALVIVADLARQVERATAAAMRQYAFTKAEGQLVQALVLGTSVNEYAQQRDVSPNTAKTQLKHVLAKTGLHRQAELVGLILGIPVTLL